MNVVFDLGAVLIGWEPVRLVHAHFADRLADETAAAQLARALFQHEDWLSFDAGLRSLDDVVSRSAQRLALPEQQLAELLVPLGERFEPIAQTEALLRELHAHRAQRPALRLFYLSNMPQPYAQALLRRLSFFECFDGGLFSGDVKRIKPDEEIYQLLAWQYQLEPERTLFIDDTAANVQMARVLGWRAIHCTAPAALAPQVWRHLAECA
ncbi:HAD family phosphatase [Xenophilus arseniciresistens]|uniref:HAD family phosphatase n=1 Tax=Xenophilus arseniciresistens TaxID=1283306 RepID=A0AAE3T0C4_9BURK|nr:HAD family phosphatase [Xenophilus arseniciresistens]MDA7416751.1 HAD family phosphatase [Xenophilus arseniciresistens]